MKSIQFCKLIIALASMLGSASSAWAYEIETISQWNGTNGIIYIGNPTNATATFGQTFSVTEVSSLTSWSFWLSNRSVSPQPIVRLDAFLMEWNGDRALSPSLFEKRGLTVPQSPSGEFFEIALEVPSVILAPEKSYVMLLNTSSYESLTWPYELASSRQPEILTVEEIFGTSLFQ